MAAATNVGISTPGTGITNISDIGMSMGRQNEEHVHVAFGSWHIDDSKVYTLILILILILPSTSYHHGPLTLCLLFSLSKSLLVRGH